MIQTVIFDFDGVLAHDRFYSTLMEKYPKVMEYVDNVIFRGDQDFANRWMRGELSYKDINELISKETGIDIDILTDLFLESIRNFSLDTELLEYARQLKEAGINIALVTNNMDIFNEITIPKNNLRDIFPVIINSFDYGILKHDENGRLFEIALKQLGVDSFANVLLIDDSEKACKTFEGRGGQVHRFSNTEELFDWSKEIFKIC